MQPEFIFKIKDGKWVWKNPHGKALVQNYLAKYNNKNRWIRCIFKIVRKPKTLEQLGYYYAAVLPTVHRELVALGHTMKVLGAEIAIDEDEADKITKYFCSRLTRGGEVLTFGENPHGEILNKRNMTKHQAMMFLDNCITWANETLSCSIPPPNKYEAD